MALADPLVPILHNFLLGHICSSFSSFIYISCPGQINYSGFSHPEKQYMNHLKSNMFHLISHFFAYSEQNNHEVEVYEF